MITGNELVWLRPDYGADMPGADNTIQSNLTEVEKGQLDGLLYDLRMRYVQASG